MESAVDITEIFGCSIDRWTRIWGDPLLKGAVSMLLYGLAGVLLLQVARRVDREDRRLWGLCSALFFFQVLNTHLDLHAWPGAFGHCLAKAQGWYDDRGPVKLAAVLLLGTSALVVFLAGLVVWWRSIRANTLLVAGVAIVLGFTLIKGAALNDAERVYNGRIGPFRLADLIEYIGIAIAAAAAVLRLGRVRAERPRARLNGLR